MRNTPPSRARLTAARSSHTTRPTSPLRSCSATRALTATRDLYLSGSSTPATCRIADFHQNEDDATVSIREKGRGESKRTIRVHL